MFRSIIPPSIAATALLLGIYELKAIPEPVGFILTGIALIGIASVAKRRFKKD
jgi:hypothetical protein